MMREKLDILVAEKVDDARDIIAGDTDSLASALYEALGSIRLAELHALFIEWQEIPPIDIEQRNIVANNICSRMQAIYAEYVDLEAKEQGLIEARKIYEQYDNK